MPQFLAFLENGVSCSTSLCAPKQSISPASPQFMLATCAVVHVQCVRALACMRVCVRTWCACACGRACVCAVAIKVRVRVR
jgi:hypothetical protein